MLTTHLARVCMKNSTHAERQEELQRAKDSVKEWTREARNWDYTDMCSRYPHTPTRLALVKDLLSKQFFVANLPKDHNLELSVEPSTGATANVQQAVTSVSDNPEETSGSTVESPNSDSNDTADPTWQG